MSVFANAAVVSQKQPRRVSLWSRLLRRHDRGLSKRVRRETAARFSQLLAEDPVVHVPAFRGRFAIDPRSELFRLLIVDGAYEATLAHLCVELLDTHRDAIDVGANVGFFTVLLAQSLQNRRVLAVEPTLHALARLRRNLDLNGVSEQTILFPGAALDQTGQTTIVTIEGQEEYSSLNAIVHPSVAAAPRLLERVAVATLDELVKQHDLNPGFIKIEVEGAELGVLRGAAETLQRCRPILLCELSSCLLAAHKSSVTEILALLDRHNYVVLDAEDAACPVGSRPFGNMVARPR